VSPCSRTQSSPPDLLAVLAQVRRWHDAGEIEPTLSDAPRLFADILSVIEASAGALNFNDSFLVILQRNGAIDDVASFDEAFDLVDGFRRMR
jgi:predicted nucleic acid-binding protein